MAKKRTKPKRTPAAKEPAIRDRIKELRRVPASALIASEKNWRTHPKSQQLALQGILDEVGYADALIAYEREGGELVLIDGHLRKDTTPDAVVPVLVLDVAEDEADKLLATLDPLAAMATADRQRLDALLRDVQTGNEAVGRMLTELAQQSAVIPDLKPTAPANDPNAEWQGMPEFEQEDQKPVHEIKILFDSEEAVQDFSRRIEQDVKGMTWTWHPKKEINKPFAAVAEDASDES